MKISRKKLIVAVLTCMIFTLMISITAFATGDVAGAVEGTWNETSVQVKQVVNNVVFPIIDLILAEISAKLGDNLVILPSSIHECIVLRESQALDMDSLKDMVETVNSTEVSLDDKLSDNVYTYDAQTQELTVYTGDQPVMQQTM